MDLIESDPPYNVAVESEKGETIANDNMPAEDFYMFLCSVFGIAYKSLKPGGAYYCWHPSSGANVFMDALKQADLPVRQTLIWVKNGFTLGRQDYQWKHEPCLYGWKEGAPHYFIDMRSLDTVSEMQSETDPQKMKQLFKAWLEDVSTVQHDNKPTKAELHPTCKPIGLIKKQIRNSSRERERVLDLFGGSGTTLLACEELNRVCYMMEFDPKYASRIIKRFELETGKKAVRVNG
jgi:DNA modification methylase